MIRDMLRSYHDLWVTLLRRGVSVPKDAKRIQ